MTIPPDPPSVSPAVSGFILAPNGDYSAASRGWRWASVLTLVPRAYASLDELQPTSTIQNVALSLVSAADAKDGSIDTPQPLAPTARSDDTGAYQVVCPTDFSGAACRSALSNVDTCRMMLAVGSDQVETRAFVLSHTTNIDAVSEAVVSVVLKRLAQSPPVLLCGDPRNAAVPYFTTSGLLNISDRARSAAFTATGDSVATFNEDARVKVETNRGVQQAICDVTGGTFTTSTRTCCYQVGTSVQCLTS